MYNHNNLKWKKTSSILLFLALLTQKVSFPSSTHVHGKGTSKGSKTFIMVKVHLHYNCHFLCLYSVPLLRKV